MTGVLPVGWVQGPTTDGWILDEDRAVRDWMKGMFGTDQANPLRPVKAWFGHPDQEIRAQDYPYVTIDLIDIEEALERVHRGNLWITRDNLPPAWMGYGPLAPGKLGWLDEMPTPINLNYQITTWARNPRHDREMLSQLVLGGRIMVRGGVLETADGRVRRLDFLEHQKRDAGEGNKRLLSNVFRIRVSSEIPYHPIRPLAVPPVTSVWLRYTPRPQPADPYDPTPGPNDIVDVITAPTP